VAFPATCPVGTGGLFPWGVKRSRRNAEHSSSAEVKKTWILYIHSLVRVRDVVLS
jgi:hypothetical protein